MITNSGITYKRTIYVNDEIRKAYEIAFRQGRYAMCRELHYVTHQVLTERLLARFKRGSWWSWQTIRNKYVVFTKKIIEHGVIN